jgi:transposase-like protein
MCTVPRPYPREFREDVIRVARNREPGVRIKGIAADFGISESCLQNWLTQADRDDGVRSGPTTDEEAENRELRRRVRLLEQENEVLRRAAAYLSQAQLPGK